MEEDKNYENDNARNDWAGDNNILENNDVNICKRRNNGTIYDDDDNANDNNASSW